MNPPALRDYDEASDYAGSEPLDLALPVVQGEWAAPVARYVRLLSGLLEAASQVLSARRAGMVAQFPAHPHLLDACVASSACQDQHGNQDCPARRRAGAGRALPGLCMAKPTTSCWNPMSTPQRPISSGNR